MYFFALDVLLSFNNNAFFLTFLADLIEAFATFTFSVGLTFVVGSCVVGTITLIVAFFVLSNAEVAVITAAPADTAVTTPLSVTVTMFLLDVDHITFLFAAVPSTLAFNVSLSPILASLNSNPFSMATLVTCSASPFTTSVYVVSLKSVVDELYLAVIVVVPSFNVLTKPVFASIVATELSDDDQVIFPGADYALLGT